MCQNLHESDFIQQLNSLFFFSILIDPACTSVKTDPPTPWTVIFTNGTTNKPEPATQAARRSFPIG